MLIGTNLWYLCYRRRQIGSQPGLVLCPFRAAASPQPNRRSYNSQVRRGSPGQSFFCPNPMVAITHKALLNIRQEVLLRAHSLQAPTHAGLWGRGMAGGVVST